MKGKHSKVVSLWKENNLICSHCGKVVYDEKKRTVDHFVPKSYNGTIDKRNLFPVCKDCNQTRGNRIVGMEFYPYATVRMKENALEYEREFSCRYRTLADAEGLTA